MCVHAHVCVSVSGHIASSVAHPISWTVSLACRNCLSNSHLEGALSWQVGTCSVCTLQAARSTRCCGQRESEREDSDQVSALVSLWFLMGQNFILRDHWKCTWGLSVKEPRG